MTGNRKLFSTYKAYNGGNVIFGSNLRGNSIGKGAVDPMANGVDVCYFAFVVFPSASKTESTCPMCIKLTFNQVCCMTQSMFAAIKARFGGNEATKRTQKALLKQQYENFNASSSESLDSIFNRLQKLVSRLAILGVVTPPEDLNVKFLRSLPSEWDTHVVVWMNKPDFDTMGLDDLYNNFKIVEQKVKKSTADNNDDKNLAFLTTSSPSSTNTINTVNTGVSTGTTKVNTASTETSTASFSDATVYAFLSTQPQGSQLVHEDLEQLHDDDLEEMDLKWNMALLSMRARKFYQRTGRKIIIDGSSTAGYDKSKVECFNCHKMGHFARECRAPRSKDNNNWRSWKLVLKAVRIEDASEKRQCVLYSNLKLSQGVSNGDLLKTELEKVKEEKEGLRFKIARESYVMPITGYDKESDNSKENTDDSRVRNVRRLERIMMAPFIEKELGCQMMRKKLDHIPKVEKKTVIYLLLLRSRFESIGFDCLLDINEQIVPRFVLEFYCQLTFTYNPESQFVVNFVIQNKSFSLTLEEFGQILKIPFKGQASNTEMWSLDHLSVSVPSRGLYKTKPPSPRVIKSLIQVPRQGQETRTKNKKTIVVGGHRDHVFACLCHMLYCIETSTPYNLAFFILKRMEKTRFKPKELLPYGMLLTRLFKHVVSVSPELAFDHYLSHDRAMHPLAPHYEQKTQADRGKKRPRESNASSSSSSTLNHPSSSYLLDDSIEEDNDESFHPNPSSPSQNISSSSNNVSRVHQNPPHESHYLNTYLSETINHQTQQRDAHREGLRSIGQALKNMMGGKRK
ncbi:pentatricopeptide repeat-containing protein [Tanacetum coccineum]